MRKGYVYGITNIVTGQWYVGKTINKRGLMSRWQNHRYNLRSGKHDNKYLQNSWDKYGERSFMFIELFSIELPLSELSEFIYMKEEELTSEKRANISDGGFTMIVGKGVGKKFPKYVKVKISKSQKGVPKLNMRGENHPNYGKGYLWKGKRHHTEETKKKLSEFHKGKKLSEETREKLSIVKKGKPLEKSRGKNHYKSIPVVQLDKKSNIFVNRYDSSMDAYRETGIHFSNINRVCNGERKSASGYLWMFEEDYYKKERLSNGESKKNII